MIRYNIPRRDSTSVREHVITFGKNGVEQLS